MKIHQKSLTVFKNQVKSLKISVHTKNPMKFTGLFYFELLPALRFSVISAAFRGKTISVM